MSGWGTMCQNVLQCSPFCELCHWFTFPPHDADNSLFIKPFIQVRFSWLRAFSRDFLLTELTCRKIHTNSHRIASLAPSPSPFLCPPSLSSSPSLCRPSLSPWHTNPNRRSQILGRTIGEVGRAEKGGVVAPLRL